MLPIDDALPALHAALASHANAVLEAPPGAGKTTRVPLSLLSAEWLEGRRIIMLEPRRLAARAAAGYMSRTLGERVGETVGYRVRGDTRVSARTRLEVVTEGVLTRLLAGDQSLESYGAVVFDEFHERSLHADLGLALTLETQQHLRPSLRVLVMSATLDGDQVARLLGDANSPAPVVRSDGRMFPVETRYRAPRAGERTEATVARTVRESLANDRGDVLVFLPGMNEQRRVAERLAGDPLLATHRATVHVLHGSLPVAEQDAAIAAAPPGQRKIVLATSIAETSLTIEGIRVVIDSGWSRLPRFDARAGLTRLTTVRVSRASADQRRGRAGRVAAGVCYRLWDAAEDHGLMPRTRPEILDAELSTLALELADAGVSDPSMMRWIDQPPAGAFAQARELLGQLGALDAAGRITPHGRQMTHMPLAPRLAHLLLGAERRGLGRLGAEIVALLEERDVLRGDGAPPPSDVRLRLEALRRTSTGDDIGLHGASIDRDAMRRVRELVSQLQRPRTRGADVHSAPEHPADDLEHTGVLLALAYPDRVAQRRPGADPRFLMRAGTGASVTRSDALAGAEWLAIAELEGAPPEYRVARAALLSRDEVLEDFGSDVVTETVVEWHEASQSVRARRRSTLGAIVLDEHVVNQVDTARVREALLMTIRRVGVDALPWNEGGSRTRARLAFMHHHRAEWPDVSSEALAASLDIWLAPHVHGLRRWSELASLDWSELMLTLLPWEHRAALDRLAPTHLEVPSGSRIALDYSNPADPILAVKLQEVFGWSATPLLCDGRIPVTMHLLSPAQRPVQVTRDLAGFWRTSYFEVRKEMRGRYPRHPWPEDPLSAIATRRAKPRGT
ncbi:MAG: ATP-dependent helicase HrpB [Gemmatimonadaceae bacterium]|nr:ATP-dependent helicase HrpB [Gemmatimonadaceae bacterium]